MRMVLVAFVMAVLVAGCDDTGQKYSPSDVQRAFHSQGFELIAVNRSDPSVQRTYETYAGVAYTPSKGEPFVVLLYDHNKGADEAIQTFRRMASPFNIRKGNIVVFSDDDVTPPMRKRIQAALAELD